MASSNAAGLRCMYIWFVVRSLCPGQLSHYGQLELRAGKWLVRVVPRGPAETTIDVLPSRL